MTLSKFEKPSAFNVKHGHFIINKTSFVMKSRQSYSSVYMSSSIIQAEQSIDTLWWGLQSARVTSMVARYGVEVPLRMIYGDQHQAKEAEKKMSRFGLMCLQVANNLKVSSVVIFLLQMATEFGYTVFDLCRKLMELFTSSVCAPQLYQHMREAVVKLLKKMSLISDDNEVIEVPDGVIQAEQSFLEFEPDQVTAIAGIMGGLAVILAAGFAGVSDYSPNKGFLKSIAEFGGKAAKMKNGLYAILACIKDFNAFVKECVMNYYGSTPADSIVKAIESMKFQFDGEEVKTEDVFEALKTLNTPEGEELMSSDMDLFRKGTAISGLLSKVVSSQIAGAFNIPSSTVALLSSNLRTFELRLKSAAVKQNVGAVRFTPFCIWMAGLPGKGKSVALGKLSRLMMQVLQKEDAMKYEVPREEMWIHSANFTQEYHTGYNGQYIFQIDDMCQDKPGTLKNSSALQFIQWVSSIPANVTQASLEDKKCPFRSKIIACTSNELYPNRVHEIMSNEAFLRRRHVTILAEESKEVDPYLNWPVKFTLKDSKDEKVPGIPFKSFYELVDFVLIKYTDHFERETRLINSIMSEDASEYFAYRQAVQAEQSLRGHGIVPIEEEEEADPLPDHTNDHMLQYYVENPWMDEEVYDWQGGPGPIVRVTGQRAPSNWVAQDWLMGLNDHLYNLVQTVINFIPLPVYHFNAGALTDQEHAEMSVSQYDARFVELLRPWSESMITLHSSYSYVFNTYPVVGFEEPENGSDSEEESEVIQAEQSAFWDKAINGVKAKVPTMDDLHNACVKSAAFFRDVWKTLYESSWWWKTLWVLGMAAASYFAYRHHVAEYGTWRDAVEADASYNNEVGRHRPIAKSAAVSSYNHEVGRSRARVTTIQAVKSSFVHSVFSKNLVQLKWPQGSLNALFIKGTTLLTCGHFFEGIAEGSKFTIVKYPKYAQPVETEVEFHKSRLVRVPGAQDCVLYHVGKAMDSFKDISTKFCKGDLPEYLDATVTSVYPEQEIVVGPVSTFVENQAVEFRAGIQGSDAHDNRPIVRVVKGFNFQGHVRRGKSGSPLIADEKVNRAPVIFGIQVCISEKFDTSYFEALTNDQIAAALGQIEAEQSLFEEADDRWDQEDEEAWFDAPEDLQNICAKSLEFIGPVKQRVHQATETKLRQSPLAPFFEPMEDTKMFKPAVLKDKSVDILTKSMAGYSRKYGTVNEPTLDATVKQFIAEDRTVRRNGDRRLLNRDEVLNGLHGQGLKGLDLNTSPGIPLTFQKQPGKPGKRTWITMGDDDQRTMSEDMWLQFDKAESDLRRGKMISLTSYACLKDELRTEEKVAAKKTRSFIVLPLLYNMLIRKYFGQWIACQHRLAGKISSAVGIDVNSDWTDLKRRLCAMGKDIEDFDYGDWDRSLHPMFFGAYSDRVSAWYGDEKGSPAWLVRELLMRQLVFMNIQVGNWLLRTHGGNKSGCAITAEINTDIHDMLTYYVWRKICQKTGRQEIASLSHFRERVALALYGDDMLKATRPDVSHWFHGNAMKVEIEELGMHITPGDKDETKGFRLRTIDEVTFLKRRFISFPGDGGRVRAPLDKSVIQRMVLWIHHSDSAVDATISNVKGALREAFFWGEDFFRDFTKRCESAWSRSKMANVPFPQVYYESVRDAWNAGHGDLMPGLFQFRVVPDPEVGAEEEL